MEVAEKQSHKDPYLQVDGLSRSQFKEILTSPKRFHDVYISKVAPIKESHRMELGTMTHMALLEPEKFKNVYEVFSELALPSVAFKTIKGQCKWKTIKEENNLTYFEVGKSDSAQETLYEKLKNYYDKDEIILPDTYAMICKCISHLKEHKPTWEALTGEVVTETVLTGEVNGHPVKACFDIYNKSTNTIIDYKTTDRSISPKIYCREIPRASLDIQAWLYSEIARQNGIDDVQFKFLIQNKSSGSIILAPAGEDVLESGERKTKLALAIYERCMAADQWAEYFDPDTGNTNDDGEITIHMPGAYFGGDE